MATPSQSEMTEVEREFSSAEVRRILLENRYCMSEEELCAKWGISRYRLRIWKRDNNYQYLSGGLREVVIAAIYTGARDVMGIIEFADHINHCRYTEAEVLAILEALYREGKAQAQGTTWSYLKPTGESAVHFIF
jgi:hypothetical protein